MSGVCAAIFSIGPKGAIHVFGVKLVGFTLENGMKLLLTFLIFFVIWMTAKILRFFIRRYMRGRIDVSALFWSNQAIKLLLTFFSVIFFISVWFDDPKRLTTGIGLIAVGLTFALQKIITSVAGYFIILRGGLFNVGDRISMGGVRGDVTSLNFTYTRVMEMGQPPSVQMADPAMWVEARQYTGRIVTITNDKVFETPLYNYTREFPFLWEEIQIALKYGSNRIKAEEILIGTAQKYTAEIQEIAKPLFSDLRRKYMVNYDNIEPKVYYRLTDDWLELTLRFITRTSGIRDLKDQLSRDILEGFEKSGIEIASSTFDIVGLPKIRVALTQNNTEK
ncbi:MAG: mechanosensitive ion channel protein MscS [Planctomycetes bacterium GWF2_42_9]|nr:MAG: mechanosensitive ion channel protein MscS [Planctomycetes bacterium GWF2_42_9]